jgi:polyisoprenoid-binding protein YceI
VTVTGTGELTLHGVTRSASVTLHAQFSTDTIELVGSIPIKLSDWHMIIPAGFRRLGSLADHGTAEFLLVLHRAAR